MPRIGLASGQIGRSHRHVAIRGLRGRGVPSMILFCVTPVSKPGDHVVHLIREHYLRWKEKGRKEGRKGGKELLVLGHLAEWAQVGRSGCERIGNHSAGALKLLSRPAQWRGEGYPLARIRGGRSQVPVAGMRDEREFSKCVPGGFEVPD